MRYIPGDYYVICDRCGFKRRQSECKTTWDNLFVCFPECWEPRHPQDLVKAKMDRQRVANPRPDNTTDLRSTVIATGILKDAVSVEVADASNISDGTAVGVVLNDGTTQWTYSNGTPAANVVTIGGFAWGAADAGNTVYVGVESGNIYIDPSDVTASDL